MARAGRKDRGLLSKPDSTGKPVWYVRLYHDGRERRFGSFPTKTKAREFYEKAKLEQKEGRFFPERYQLGGYAKLEDVLNDYLDAFTGRSTRDETRYKKTWLDLLPGARLNSITPALLEKLRAQLSEGGRSPQTVNRYMQFLRRVLNKAVRDGKLASNPVSRIKMFKEPAADCGSSRRRKSRHSARPSASGLPPGCGWPFSPACGRPNSSACGGSTSISTVD